MPYDGRKIIKRRIDNGNIIFYRRFVDDCFCALKKGTREIILSEMNSFDPYLKFTIEEMVNGQLNYLDTTCYKDNKNIYQLKMFIKPSASEVKTDFRNSVQPKKYKISSLVGDLYRCHYTTTTNTDLDNALKKMTQIYLRNGFPRRLIQDKITDLKKRNFSPSEFRRQRDEDIRNNPHRNHNLILTYSSRRCDTVIQKLLRTVKAITPQF